MSQSNKIRGGRAAVAPAPIIAHPQNLAVTQKAIVPAQPQKVAQKAIVPTQPQKAIVPAQPQKVAQKAIVPAQPQKTIVMSQSNKTHSPKDFIDKTLHFIAGEHKPSMQIWLDEFAFGTVNQLAIATIKKLELPGMTPEFRAVFANDIARKITANKKFQKYLAVFARRYDNFLAKTADRVRHDLVGAIPMEVGEIINVILDVVTSVISAVQMGAVAVQTARHQRTLLEEEMALLKALSNVKITPRVENATARVTAAAMADKARAHVKGATSIAKGKVATAKKKALEHAATAKKKAADSVTAAKKKAAESATATADKARGHAATAKKKAAESVTAAADKAKGAKETAAAAATPAGKICPFRDEYSKVATLLNDCAESSSPAEVKKKYLQLARWTHPDKNKGCGEAAETAFKYAQDCCNSEFTKTQRKQKCDIKRPPKPAETKKGGVGWSRKKSRSTKKRFQRKLKQTYKHKKSRRRSRRR